MNKYFMIISLGIISLGIMYKVYIQCTYYYERIYDFISLPKNGQYREIIVTTIDVIFDSNQIFTFNLPFSKFKSVFSETEYVKKESRQFFKETFGFTDKFLKLFMFEFKVNDDIDYRVQYTQSGSVVNQYIKDGGHIVYVPHKTKLHGTYGGKQGIQIEKGGFVMLGYYIIGSEYKIRYTSIYPLITHKTYDGAYTPIECDIEIIESFDKKLIGLKGKAQGIYKVSNYRGISNHILVRNVMTFV